MKLAKSGKYCLCAFIIIFICIYMAVPVKAEARRVVRVGFPEQEGFTEKGRDGHYSGYTYDYLHRSILNGNMNLWRWLVTSMSP